MFNISIRMYCSPRRELSRQELIESTFLDHLPILRWLPHGHSQLWRACKMFVRCGTPSVTNSSPQLIFVTIRAKHKTLSILWAIVYKFPDIWAMHELDSSRRLCNIRTQFARKGNNVWEQTVKTWGIGAKGCQQLCCLVAVAGSQMLWCSCKERDIWCYTQA